MEKQVLLVYSVFKDYAPNLSPNYRNTSFIWYASIYFPIITWLFEIQISFFPTMRFPCCTWIIISSVWLRDMHFICISSPPLFWLLLAFWAHLEYQTSVFYHIPCQSLPLFFLSVFQSNTSTPTIPVDALLCYAWLAVP